MYVTDIVLIVALIGVLVLLAWRYLRSITLGTFLIDQTGKGDYSGVLEFHKEPEDIAKHKFVILTVEQADLRLDGNKHPENSSQNQ